MIAIEATIVATAMPQIVAQLGGLHLYSWVFSSFLLTQTAMTVVFGKLSDVYGRKPMILMGIAIFLVGINPRRLCQIDDNDGGLSAHYRASEPVPSSRLR